jgi:hypothetical protein
MPSSSYYRDSPFERGARARSLAVLRKSLHSVTLAIPCRYSVLDTYNRFTVFTGCSTVRLMIRGERWMNCKCARQGKLPLNKCVLDCKDDFFHTQRTRHSFDIQLGTTAWPLPPHSKRAALLSCPGICFASHMRAGKEKFIKRKHRTFGELDNTDTKHSNYTT